MPVFPVVEALKEIIDGFAAHQLSAIRNLDFDLVVEAGERDSDPSVCWCVFGSVRKQVINDLIDLVRVKPSPNARGRGFEREM